MKKADVHIGATYLVKVASNLVPVRIDREHKNGGWVGTSVKTGKTIRIKSPQRLRKQLADAEDLKAIHKADQENARLAEKRSKSKDGQTASERAMSESAPKRKTTTKADKPKRTSGLDAAAAVLAEAGEPLNTKEMVERMLAQGLWQTNGQTPAATIYSAIVREIATKRDAARFRKVERGKFERVN